VSGQTGSNVGCPGTGGATLAGDAVVVDVLSAASGTLVSTPQGGTIDVSVAVDPASAGAVACNAAAGNVAVVVLPAGGQAPAQQSVPAAPGRSTSPPPNSSGSPSPPIPTGTG
jgi:hypothetical protein